MVVNSPPRPSTSTSVAHGAYDVNASQPPSPIGSGGINNNHHRPVTALGGPTTYSYHTYTMRPSTSSDDVSGRYSFYRQRVDRANNHRSLPFCPSSKLPAFLEHDRRVLLFDAYYEEDVLQSPVESNRITKCEIYFFVEDGTIEIVQTKQENSGIPQGVFLRRSRVEKPRQGVGSLGSRYYEIDDLKIGNQVEIYSRTFHIVSCNESTRKYVIEAQGWHEVDVAPLPFPHDTYAELNSLKMSRESGVPGIDRKRKMNDLKQVMESILGKPTAMADRGAFLENGQDTLCFHAVWDDRKRLYGDVQCFSLLYYLADGTFEILPVHETNGGREQFPKLLKRCKLPKPRFQSSGGGHSRHDISSGSGGVDGDGGGKYYTWRDLGIGKQISIFGRTMLLARCDNFTRQHFSAKGIELKPDLPLKTDGERFKVRIERQIPPYNGFGSEEDSLRSCVGLHSPPPKKNPCTREKSGVVLRFNANLEEEDTDLCYGQDINTTQRRLFVIQFFMEDDTVAIREPPIQNSGVVGGAFLRRQAIKKADGSKYEPRDFFCGNIIEIAGHRFVLISSDESSYKVMENDHRNFPYSDVGRLQKLLAPRQGAIRNYFVANYCNGDGKLDSKAMEECLLSVGLRWNKQEIITLWRSLDKRKRGKVSFTKLLKAANVAAALGGSK
eukprot:CAMPEP_0181045132 /NCGR_PEP_ID=MMETSP1070-20121207/13641_1 /TAXON_ID=265543 /ORGANISM="Minutocellus polymorphus, Strain NH13" /LENGTH=666 /DNA_ID=CAMNT_0023123633 /DNA_START=312 /DNA_END=2312 /DNA_ORIENTATION=-